MKNSWYSFDVSPGWVLAAVLLAFLLSFFLYSKKGMPWKPGFSVFLGFLRLTSIFLVVLLLLNPLLQFNQNEALRPVIALAIDNSKSIPLRTPDSQIKLLKNWLDNLNSQLGDLYKIETFLLGNESDSLVFEEKITDLNKLLNNIETITEGQNPGAIVLASDGIVNQGQSPAYSNYKFPVYTIGLGDTIPPKDISIADVRANRVAYQGNKFPIQVNVLHKGFNGTSIKVTISEAGKVIDQKNLVLGASSIEPVSFTLDALEPGLKRYRIRVSALKAESSYQNNHRDIFVDIIEGKEKILILATAPHPDIKAIRSALSETENYETTLYIPGISKTKPVAKNFDVIIEHQAFSNAQFSEYTSNGKWYILGDQYNKKQLSGEISFLNIAEKGKKSDKVVPACNEDFSKFKLTKELVSRFKNYPPVNAPFANYTVTGPTEILLYQRLGNIVTDRPILLFFDDGIQKKAVQLGTNIWRWKLQEAGIEGNTALFKEYVLKTVQFLSIKARKDRFIVKPRKPDYLVGDKVFLDTEVYNEIYERSYGHKITLNLTSEDGPSSHFEMVDSPTNSSFNIGTRPSGIYTYKSTVTMAGKTFTESGSFAVQDILLEGIDLTADHNLLKTISKNTGGFFYQIDEADKLTEDLRKLNLKSTIQTSERFVPLINSIWIVLVIGLLLSTEWFFRKYLGAY